MDERPAQAPWMTPKFVMAYPNAFLAMRKMQEQTTHHTRIIPNWSANGVRATCSCGWSDYSAASEFSLAARKNETKMVPPLRAMEKAAEFHWQHLSV